jgi:uncharacterized protein (DUF736 family)
MTFRVLKIGSNHGNKWEKNSTKCGDYIDVYVEASKEYHGR